MFCDNQCIVTLTTAVLLWLLNSHDAPIAGQNVVSFHSSVASHQNWVRVGSRTVQYEYDGVWDLKEESLIPLTNSYCFERKGCRICPRHHLIMKIKFHFLRITST